MESQQQRPQTIERTGQAEAEGKHMTLTITIDLDKVNSADRQEGRERFTNLRPLLLSVVDALRDRPEIADEPDGIERLIGNDVSSRSPAVGTYCVNRRAIAVKQ